MPARMPRGFVRKDRCRLKVGPRSGEVAVSHQVSSRGLSSPVRRKSSTPAVNGALDADNQRIRSRNLLPWSGQWKALDGAMG